MSAGYYDTYEAAKLLGVSASTIRSWVHRGRLPQGRMIRGRLHWTKAQLVAARADAKGADLAAALSKVVDARCGCGSQATVQVGLAGYMLVTCSQCGTSMAVETASEYITRQHPNELEIAPRDDPESVLASRVAAITAKQSKGNPLVYFIRLGPYVKIGTSVDVMARIGALSLSPGNLLAVIPGSYDVERQTHQRFARLRAFREWFYLRDELRDYVMDLQRRAVEEFTTPSVSAA